MKKRTSGRNRFWKGTSYQRKLMLTILCLVLPAYLAFSVLYLRLERPLWEASSVSSYSEKMEKCADQLSFSAIHMRAKLEAFSGNTEIRSEIARIDRMKLSQLLDFNYYLKEIASMMTAGGDGLIIRLYLPNVPKPIGQYCYTMEYLYRDFPEGENDPAYQKILHLSEEEYFWLIQCVPRGMSNRGDRIHYLCLYTRMIMPNGSQGIVEFCLPIRSNLKGNIPSLPEEGVFAVVLSDGKDLQVLPLSPDWKGDAAEKVKKAYTSETSDYYLQKTTFQGPEQGEVVYLLPDTYVKGLVRPRVIVFMVLSVIFLLLVMGVSYLTSHLLTRRIDTEVAVMNEQLDQILTDTEEIRAKEGDLDQIQKRVLSLIIHTKEYMASLEHYQQENARLELEILQLRFNPHLLYNTLGALRYQVRDPAIKRTIGSMIQYYRIILSEGKLFIHIDRECAMIRAYFDMEKAAYDLQNVTFRLEIDEEVKEYYIIKHLLQPIVENALTHGILAREEGGGTIVTRARSSGNSIIFTIEDNGVGMKPEEVEALLSGKKDPSMEGGYGVRNVKARMELYYGSESQLRIHSIPGEGTTVTLVIPKQSQIHEK